MPMPVPLNLEVVSKHPPSFMCSKLTAFNSAGKGTAQMLDISSAGCPGSLPPSFQTHVTQVKSCCGGGGAVRRIGLNINQRVRAPLLKPSLFHC